MVANSPPETEKTARLVLTGGGTSGHVNPCLAMAQAFEDRLGRAEIRYFGIRGRAEEAIVPQAGLRLEIVPSAPYVSPRRPLKMARFVAGLSWGILKAAAKLIRFRPDYILATGGYAAAPTVMAQTVLNRLGLGRAKIVLHEANAVLGKLNQLMARRADFVFLTFPSSREDGRRVRMIGYPVRGQLTAIDRAEALRRLEIDPAPGTKIVLIFGGSQGARNINRAVIDALEHIEAADPPVLIIHGQGLGSPSHRPEVECQERLIERYGPDFSERFARCYHPLTYIHDMTAAYSAADLVVCRSGAGAIHEVSALGKPALLVPKPNLPGDHQVRNARSLAAAGGAEIIYENALAVGSRIEGGIQGRVLADRILALLAAPDRLDELAQNAARFMRGDAAEAIARLVIDGGGDDLRPSQAQPPAPPPTHSGLLTLLGRARAANGAGYDPAIVIGDGAELDYYRRRSALLLTEPAWPVRNVGVKLIGLLGDVSSAGLLVNLITDRRPVSGLKRLLGGDFEQVGFIRRNAVDSLVQLNELNPDIEQALKTALADPYFEVRSHAARAVGHFAERLTDRAGFQGRLIKAARDSSFEVAGAAVLALGRVGCDRRAVEALIGLKLSRHWQIRRAALAALTDLVRRGEIDDPDGLREEVVGFVTTATDFTPRFALKAAYQALMDEIGRDRPARLTGTEPGKGER